jgi:HPt (histidine-containing phosphotransfer) domain-containing protein
MDVIFSNSSLDANVLAQMHTAIGACIGAGQMNYELNAHLLASGFDKTLPDGRVKSLASSWSPICDEHGLVAKLLLCIRDVTEIKRLENEANTRKRQLQMIGEILAVVQERFHAFAASATNFLEENRRLLEQASEPCADMANHLFRNMHTVKGSARTLALLELTNRAHLAEQSYAGLRKNPDAAWDRNHLLAELATVREMLDKYVDVNDTVLGRKGPGRRREIEKFLMVERSSVQELLRELMSVDQSNASAMHGALEHVGRMLNAVNTAQGPTAS